MDKFDEVQNFLSVVCMPAESELKLMASDNIREWKLSNVTSVFSKAKEIVSSSSESIDGIVDPKIALSIIDNSSNEKEPELQEMWAGLFVSSINKKPSDENLIYTNILRQLTLHEARIIKYMCDNCSVSFPRGGIPEISGGSLYNKDFFQFTGKSNVDYHESLIAHINSLRLNKISWGSTGEIFRFTKDENEYVIHLIPTVLCLNLYLKCNGLSESITEHYKK